VNKHTVLVMASVCKHSPDTQMNMGPVHTGERTKHRFRALSRRE